MIESSSKKQVYVYAKNVRTDILHVTIGIVYKCVGRWDLRSIVIIFRQARL